ncbi:hypothetical protein [Candidatus Scalindua japonica]|nr:hypothetical protein [Candidatus Scalindua japonica]
MDLTTDEIENSKILITMGMREKWNFVVAVSAPDFSFRRGNSHYCTFIG